MATAFRCRLVTPTDSMLDQPATYVSFPAWDGQKGVVDGTSPFLAQVGVGSLRVDLSSGGSRWYLLDGGFAQMDAEAFTILANRAWPAEALREEATRAQLRAPAPGSDAALDRKAIDHAAQLAREAEALAAGQRGA